MFKILPAVLFTAILTGGTNAANAQSRGFDHPYPPKEVIIIDDHRAYPDRDHRDYDDRYERDDRYDRNGRYDRHGKHGNKRNKKYRHHVAYPLVIIHTRNLPVRRYGHNRYFYRNQAGMHYWLGRDGRLYLDEKFVGMARYNDHEYRQWRRGY